MQLKRSNQTNQTNNYIWRCGLTTVSLGDKSHLPYIHDTATDSKNTTNNMDIGAPWVSKSCTTYIPPLRKK